jgi:acetylornithine/N-succinyldiaminopimelate aminotransferase
MNTRRQLFFRHVAQTSELPPAYEITGGKGVFAVDAAGKRYYDFISGIAVSSFGHANTEITAAIHEQVDAHLHIMVYGEYIISKQVELAEALSRHLPGNLSSVYFTNSGSEAVEGAMKLAKRFTGRTHFVSFRNAYHGSTQGALSICGNEILKNAYRPLLPGHILCDYNNFDHLNKITSEVSAVVMEVIQAEAGIILPENNFLSEVRKKCTETGTLLIFDEIQTGFSRTGKLFAFQHWNVIPDILLLGKAFGGGMPLGAFISSPEIMKVLSSNPALGHMSTSGGHPVSCAASLAALQIATAEGFTDAIKKRESILKNALRHKRIKEVRGMGLFYAIEFESEMFTRAVIDRCYENGLLSDWFLFAPNCMRLAPPLTISADEMSAACEIIMNSVSSAG